MIKLNEKQKYKLNIVLDRINKNDLQDIFNFDMDHIDSDIYNWLVENDALPKYSESSRIDFGSCV